MSSNFTIALIVALAAGGWVYFKFQNRTGGNTRSSLTGAAVVTVLVLVVLMTLLTMFLK